MKVFRSHAKFVKFVVAGGAAALVNFGTFILTTQLLKVHYLLASVIAFVMAAITSFVLQKFWTFRHRSLEDIHVQFSIFVFITGCNLAINTVLVYVFVEWVSLGHLLSQIAAGVLVAIESFYLFSRIVFREDVPHQTEL